MSRWNCDVVGSRFGRAASRRGYLTALVGVGLLLGVRSVSGQAVVPENVGQQPAAPPAAASPAPAAARLLHGSS